MKLDLNNIQQIKDFIQSLPDTDLYIAEGYIRRNGSSAMLPMPKAWEGKKVRYLVIPI